MGFVEMGIVVEQVTVLKPGPKFTLAMLADRADPKGRTDGRVECWPSIRELVRRTAQSKSTVLRQLNYLQEIGLIEVEKRWHTDASGQARQATNRYIINLPGIHRGEFRADEVIYSHDTEPEPTAAPLGVTMTLKPKTPGHAKGSNLTPKGEYGCQNPQSMGVTGDTPRKTNINTNPSPSLPHDEGPPANPDGGGATAPGEEDSP
uniref:helix-turn-helix domain-containing protein n=1 Tax=Corynebacterium mastitidis TaxID=161890 RepID=UPI0003616EE9